MDGGIAGVVCNTSSLTVMFEAWEVLRGCDFSGEGKEAIMKEEAIREENIDKTTLTPVKKSLTGILKAKTKALMAHNCKGCSKREEAVHKAAAMGGKVVVGVGAGRCLGVGALAAAAVAEVAIPAILTFKALALTGGALGLVKGTKDLKK